MTNQSTCPKAGKVQCLAPWTHFYIMEKGYGPCCDVTFPVGNQELEKRLESHEDFIELFNSNSYINLRQAFLEDRIPYSCKVCIECGYNKEYDGAEALGLEATAMRVPRSVSLVVESPCNINCVFCKSIRTDRDPEGDFRTFTKLFDRLEEIGWENLDFIRVGGGEPFFNPGFVRFIESYDWSRTKGTGLKITTNATLLHKVLGHLTGLSRVDFTLSIDAMGKNYEALRRGASWERVLANLQDFSDMARTQPGWSATIHSIVMKSSLPDISDLMSLANELGFGYSVMNLHGKYYKENVFLFPDLLDAGWEETIDGAIKSADSCGFDSARKDLVRFRQYLQDKVAGNHTPIRGFSCCDFRLRLLQEFFDGLAGKRYAVVGMDDKFIQLCQSTRRLDGLSFITDRAVGISDFMGYPFRDAAHLEGDAGEREAAGRDLDFVVICCSTYEFDKYSKLAEALFPSLEKRYAPFFDRQALDNIRKIVAMDVPMVAFCTGGTAKMLLEGTDLGLCDFVAFADNNAKLHGTTFRGKPVIAPDDMADFAEHLVILSDGFAREIEEQIRREGHPLTVQPLF